MKNISDKVKFDNLPIGGGGYVTGIVMHPRHPEIKYIRTDVGGAYRWNEENDLWEPMTDFFSSEETIMYGIDGIAISESNPDIVYISCGNGGKCSITPAVYKSADRGHTFKRTNLEKWFFGNGPWRQAGESILIDPEDENRVYCGSRDGELYLTLDGGNKWTKIGEGLPTGKYNVGLRSIALDRKNKNIMYAGYPGGDECCGGYISSDGGLTFTKMKDIPNDVRRIKTASDGRAYLTTSNGVYMIKDGTVTDISPKDEKRTYLGLAVGENPDVLAVCHAITGSGDCMKQRLYYSADGGKTWALKTDIFGVTRRGMPLWWPNYYFSSATASLLFLPGNDRELWFTDWYGVWMTRDIAADVPAWELKIKGHEEAVVEDILSNKEGNIELVTAMVDNGGMYYTDVNKYPPKRIFGNGVSLDFCENHPEVVVVSETDNGGKWGVVKVSHDYGVTYRETSPTGTTALDVSVSCDNPDNMVFFPINGCVRYTRDGGKTWCESTGAPDDIAVSFWGSPRCIAADRVKDGVFYLCSHGRLYISCDGGETWNAQASLPVKNAAYIAASPATAGEILIAADRDGLFFSRDFGKTCIKIEGVERAQGVSYGIDKTGKRYIIYIKGIVDGENGLFVTEDFSDYSQMNGENNKMGLGSRITADRRVYGRVFILTGGRGIIKAETED